MSKIVFLDSPSTVYDADFSQIGANQLRLTFKSDKPSDVVLLSGLRLINEYNGYIQTRREDYKYIYRVYENNPLMIELCNDGVEYVEPEPVIIPEPEEPVLTEEEKAEQERMNQTQELDTQISTLKAQLTSSDYKIIKEYEYSLVSKESEYNMDVLHKERQTIRDEINRLEKELQGLYQNEE